MQFKVIGIRPMAPVLSEVHLRVSEHEMLSFSVRKEIIKRIQLGCYFIVQSSRKRIPSDCIANPQSRIIILPLFRHAYMTET